MKTMGGLDRQNGVPTRHVFDAGRATATLAMIGLLIAGCGAPTASAPTSPAAAPSAEAAGGSPAAKPGAKPSVKPSLAASPAAAAAAASPVPAGAIASPAPAAGPAVNAPLLFSGPLTPGFVLQSSAFTDGGDLPSQYSCDGPGGGQSPPLNWTGAPSSTRAFALVDQDPDTGGAGSAFTHWVVFNIPANITQFEAGLPAGDVLPNGGLQGQNGRRIVAYQGACPPAGSAPHHYTFQLWALTGPLALPIGASILDLQRAMTGNVVGQTKLVALFAH